ncbi:undecaprenyldiphospho-muramoylpentapeptide beta-N-acetylglucosaminyltransferase [Idiomarina seosinensis]|uniref:UDP-N-acetylglucosamine--N-acetylmuramyl-(pentapeptide) pyrophosphoryl-undecaprenol N-acetylglucosamine transferase n=1 Tax=Idiomarina seosinensis TaxID=281739 RepID=A0A432ZD82_9GAMM|nr:undecaprenyldiphospho-muramoylpentapeptide beta-N-acetylglucosaminyltransferase [Idiomarina seosinensis]RUO75884.1 undecaprenyldiphospho-muramoylpentapeptide beta-N-acetylglucosaminyltransferase [Idiomarina seosinensis]
MPTALIAAAGTGGHVFPALAVAERLIEQGWQVAWLGTEEGRLESRVVPAAGIELHKITMTGVRGHGLARMVKAPWILTQAVRQCRQLLGTIKPDVVITFGGYVCAPLGIAARLKKLPLLVHEQNAVPGLTTRLLAPFANIVMLGLPLVKKPIKKAQLTGNPLRKEVLKLAAECQQHAQTEPTVNLLVVGGSLGAKVLNDTVPEALAQLDQAVRVMHQAGEGNRQQVENAYQVCTQHQVKVVEFIDQMGAAYQQADLVICRAGALTVSELAVLGKPAIFVPLPHAVDDHQTANASAMVTAGGAVLMPQQELTAERLAKQLQSLLQEPEQLWKMARFARQCGSPEATDTVTQICINAVQQKAA